MFFSKKNSKKFGKKKKTSYLCNRKQENNALVAQLVEHLTLNQGVPGSSPGWVTTDSSPENERFRVFIFSSVLPGRIFLQQITEHFLSDAAIYFSKKTNKKQQVPIGTCCFLVGHQGLEPGTP